MSLIYEERLSDSPFVETMTHGWTVSDGSPIRPAECHWHIVLVRQNGNVAACVASDQARTMTATVVNISCGAIMD